MLAEPCNNAPRGQFVGAKVNLAAAAYLHRGHPLPTVLLQVRLIDAPGDTVPGAHLALPPPRLAGALDASAQVVVDLLIREFGGYGYGAYHTVACIAPVARGGSAAVVVYVAHESSRSAVLRSMSAELRFWRRLLQNIAALRPS